MRVADVQHGRATLLELDLDGPGAPSHGLALTEAQLVFPDGTGDTLLRIEEAVYRAEPSDARSRAALSRLREANLPRVAWLSRGPSSPGPLDVVLLEVREFASHHDFAEPMDLGVDEKIVEHVQLRRRSLRSIDDVLRYLTEKVLLPPATLDGSPRALMSGSPSRGMHVERAFRLHGDGIAVDVARRDDERLQVVRVVEARRPTENDERRPVTLVSGALRFCDATVVGQLRGSARTQLDRIVETAGSYLAVWKEYNGLERERIVRRAQAFGWIHYDNRTQLPDGRWRFRLTEAEGLEETLLLLKESEDIDLEAASAPPPELLGQASQEGKRRGRTFAGSATCHLARRTIDVLPLHGDDAEEPPKEGVLFVSLSGDRKRLERREEAQAQIASAECQMPQLGLLIEGAAVPERRRRAEEPLSAAAREVFGGAPTQRQIEALRVALATPDIALIQGPPGTGKTRTIAALQIRLAEIAEERSGSAGRTLLTSYQHDAVENAADKTLVFGLPAIKIGKRRGQAEEVDGFERWRRDRIEGVRADLARFPERPASAILRKVRHLAIAYTQAPRRDEDAAALLGEVLSTARGLLPPALVDRLVERRQALSRSSVARADGAQEDLERARKAVRALRVTAGAFADDGARNAHRARLTLDPLGALAPDERVLLERAADWQNDEPPPFLADLAALQGALLDRLADERPRGAPAASVDVEALLAEAVDALHRRVRASIEGEEAVLHEYLDDLEHDAEGVREAVRTYTVVLAATCQQSVGYHMSLAKSEGPDFEDVIVDEAARANPLDLFIPMSRARRRIILVGDHRQLPHILEPDLEAELEQSTAEATREALRKSLFQRLFESLQEREARDHIKRTVTLDVQYRMHPILGKFVSDTFYEPHGEAFGSGRPPEDFTHGLSRYRDAVAAWVDVPLQAGRESPGKSKRRSAEAQWIAREVAEIVKERPDLGIGVVSFYAAQVDEILRALEPLGLCARLDDGTLGITAHLRETERLRVGTVDAFQGKEFDVVFLSITRSNDFPADGERALRRKYGHLLLENRLCVAMSRQRKLLVAVGDAAMIQSEAGARSVPALAAFRDLCEGAHGICISA